MNFHRQGASTELKSPEDEKSSIAGHASWRLRQSWFPNVDTNGAVYTRTAGTTGAASLKSRKVLTDLALTKHLTEHFPQGALAIAGPPHLRASTYKETGQQGTVSAFFGTAGAATKPAWTKVTAALAAREFELPEGATILFLFPDLFDRDLLSRDPLFQRPYKDSNNTPKLGVLTPCPACHSNLHLKVSGWSCHKGTVRRILDMPGCLFINTPEYICTSASCQNGKSSRKFSPHSPEVWGAYPLAVRERYKKYMFTAVADGHQGELLCTEEFCLEILNDQLIFNQQERVFKEKFDRNKTRAISTYKEFVESERMYNDSNEKNRVEDFDGLWPKFGEKRYDRDFMYPKRAKIHSVFDAAFELIHKYLLQDLFSRTPGQFIRWDATFKFMSKTSDDPESDEENNALHVVWGTHGHVLTFAFAGSEQIQVFQRLMYFLKRRCFRIGGIEEVNRVQFGFSDTCCEGLIDPSLHWFLVLWPGAVRAPMKDLFHGFQNITSQTSGTESDLNQIFTSALSTGCLKFDEDGKTAAARKYMQSTRGANLCLEAAKDQVMKVASYKKSISNRVPPPDELVAAVDDAYSRIKRLDDERAYQANAANKGYIKYLKSAVADKRMGTENAVLNAKKHILKGCWSDPLPMDQMNVPIDPEDPESEKLRLRGTSGGESNNKTYNKMVEGIGRQSTDLAYKKAMLRIHRWNLDKDNRLAKVLGIEEPRTLEWYLHKALQEQSETYANMVYPPDVPTSDEFNIDEGSEPIGPYYNRYTRWQKIDDELLTTRARQASQARVSLNLSHSEHTESAAAGGTQGSTSSSPDSPIATSTTRTPESPIPAAPAPAVVSIANNSSPSITGWNAGLGRSGDVAAPAASCTRMIGGKVPTATPLNTFVSDTRPLSDFQRQMFWKIINDWHRVQQNSRANPPGVDKMVQQIVASWGQGHYQTIGQGGVGNAAGFGGLMRAQHAKELFLAGGRGVLQGQFLMQPPAQQLPYRRHVMPTIPVPSSHSQWLAPIPQRTATPTPTKRTKKEKQVHVFKGMSTALSQALTKEDICRVLLQLNKPSSNKRKGDLLVVMARALEEQTDGFVLNFTYIGY
jgi:hypothetical protein